jgi:hypothetical protein
MFLPALSVTLAGRVRLTKDPGGMTPMISWVVTMPLMGMPFAKPLANTMISGVMPECSMAKPLPVR